MLQTIIYFYKRKIEPGIKIPRDAKVIDLGSGDKPFWRGDIFLDKLAHESQDIHRITKQGVIKNVGSFIDADITNIPIKNKYFDFSFCSHVLEHLEEPQKALNEIQRISKAGYIEVPDGIVETIEPRRSHFWFIFLNNNKLVFIRKSKTMQEILYPHGRKHIYLFKKMKEPFIRLYWKDKIDYEVIDNLSKKDKQIVNEANSLPEEFLNQGPYILIIKALRFLFYKPKSKNLLKDSLRQKPQ